MPKLKIKVHITTNEEKTSYETIAIYCDRKLKYREPNSTLVIFNMEENTLERENKDLKMIYNFDKNKETRGCIKIKELNKEINLSINTEELNINKINIFIDFKVEENHFIYRIEEIKWVY